MDERTLAEYGPRIDAARKNRSEIRALRAIATHFCDLAQEGAPEAKRLIERRIQELDQEFAAL